MIQTWEYKIGARVPAENEFSEKLKLLNHPSQLAVMYYEKIDDSAQTEETRTTVHYQKAKQPAGYFRIPAYCPTTMMNYE